MRNILKSFTRPRAAQYEFPAVEELKEPENVLPEPEAESEERAEPHTPMEFASVQAEALVEDARRQAAELLESARAKAEQEAEQLRREGRDQGYRDGYAEGLAHATAESKAAQEQQAQRMQEEIAHFLENASRMRDSLMDETLGELGELALTVAEKIVRVSLKSSSEVISRMILAATEKLKRREWVHIYIAGCDARGMAQASPALTAALAAVSNHVKIVPMADDESGTCIIEMPDEIIDASASTQLSNIRDMMADIHLTQP